MEQKIATFDEQFDLVLITERFEESMVMLQDLLCWPLEEFAFLRQNERLAEGRSNMTEETRATLHQWLWADYLLYNHFKEKLERKLEDRKGIKDKVSELKRLNSRLEAECVTEEGSNRDIGLKGEQRMASNMVHSITFALN